MDYSGQASQGCGTPGHDGTCLCDVIVTDPVDIDADALRYMWHLDRAAQQIKWSIGDNPLDLLEAVALGHDRWVQGICHPDFKMASEARSADIEDARRHSMQAVSLQRLEAERAKSAAAFIACDGSTEQALDMLGWDFDTFLIRCHLYARAFHAWTPSDCDRYIEARTAGTPRSALAAEFGFVHDNFSPIDTCVGMGQLMAMRGTEEVFKRNKQISHTDEIREFVVQGRRNGIAVSALVRQCHQRFGQAPSRPTIYRWERLDIEATAAAGEPSEEEAA